MALIFRWLLRIFVASLALGVLALGLAWYLAARSLPDYNADFRVNGVSAPVEIVRDSHDVPHIFGRTDIDSFFGLGFAHAQDRLWQMTLLRRTAQGRLSEVFGPRTLSIDDFVRRLDLYGLAAQSLQYQAPRERAQLEAYARGVNAWINTVRSQALGRGAPEFFLFSNKIQPWTATDSLAIMRLMALKLSTHLRAEVLRAETSLALRGRKSRLQDILPDAPGPGLMALPRYGSLFPKDTRFASATGGAGGGGARRKDPLSLALDPLAPMGFGGASNAWAAAPGRTAGKASLLANDPHLDFSAPTIWYLARLKLSSGDVIGATIPGMPPVLLGRSADLGWGLTSSYMDDQDLHLEKLNPDNPDEYLTPSGFKPFVTRKTVIQIKGAPPVTRLLRWTENGPVIPGSHYDLGRITPRGYVMSLSWTALDPKDLSMTAALRLMRAKTVAKAIDAVRQFTAPSQNLTLVDKNSIALQMIGKMPARQPGNQSKGRLPTPGWLEQNRWRGYLPYENNPRIINPLGGIVANTNNKIVDRPFPNHISYTWGDTQRIERLQKLLGSRKVHTRASFIEAQLDEVSFSARALLPLIARDLWFAVKTPPPAGPALMRKTALDLLAQWNGAMNEHLPEPLIYAAWMRALQQQLIRDELGPLAKKFSSPDPVFLERVFRNVNGAAAWCDIVQTTKVETCTEIARSALDIALAELAKTYGPKVESWRWGDAHQATQDHQILGTVPVLKWFVNIRQSTSGGDNTLMRGKTKATGPNPYLNVHGAGYRGVYDFSDPDSSVYVISTGQSGHFLSGFYDDQAQLWRRGDYLQMSLDPALARAAAVGISHLLPAK